jgi:OOP family OmpA-OmpF porin
MVDEGERAADRGPDRHDDLSSLRALIVGPEQRRLAALQSRLDDKAGRAEDLAEVLPRVLLQHAQDAHFTAALTPPIEKAITTSVQRNPKPLADALFPVMGPAIRKAVSAGLASMVDSLNRTLEQAVSWRSLRWRIEAMRTGKPFAEIVLAKTLLYRVEQVFLIDRKSGLLLQHVWSESAAVQDADMVSGMLTAIKDFVQDSFKVAATDSLEALKVGDLSVWIEPGPYAIVAAVIRGSAPAGYRARLQEAVETIHLQFGSVLEAFDGDTSGLADAKSTLESCLHAEFRADERKPRTRSTWVIASLVVIALLVWGGFRWRESRHWAAYLDALRAEPGIVVLSADRQWRGFSVSGLRDPLARDPQSLLAPAGVAAGDVHAAWTPYYALEPGLIAARAAAVLHPPAGTSLTVQNGVLSLNGQAPIEWIVEAKRLASFVAGVTSFDTVGALAGQAREAIAGIQGQTLLFTRGEASLVPGQESALQHLTTQVELLARIAGLAGQRYRLDIFGHTDADGADDSNMSLSQARAAAIKAALTSAAGAQIELATEGEGSREPVVVSDNERDKQRNRRVEIKVTLIAGGAGNEGR